MTEQQLKNLSWPRAWRTPSGIILYYPHPNETGYCLQEGSLVKKIRSPISLLSSHDWFLSFWGREISYSWCEDTELLTKCAEVVSRYEGRPIQAAPCRSSRTKDEIKAALLERTRLAGPRRKFFLNKKLK